MVRFSLQFAVSLAIAVAVIGAPSNSSPRSNAASSADTILPSKDSFYVVPDDVADYEPGAILRHRPVPSVIGVGEPLGYLEESWQVLYRTTDSLGNATATVLTVMIPPNADLDKLLSFQVAENEATIDCAPSYGLQLIAAQNATLSSKTVQIQGLLAEAALAKGWVVITSDYWGPKGAYLAYKLAGRAILDGIRAAINSRSFTGISQDPRTTLWGYSIAAPATQWAVELQPSYASELSIAGAAIGGGSADISGSVTEVNGGRASGFIPLALIGLSEQYPELKALINEHLKPEYRDAFYVAKHQCLEANLKTYGNEDISVMFDDLNAVVNSPVFKQVQLDNANDPETSIPTIPLFWYQCINDTTAPIAEVDELIDSWCATRDVSIEYERNVAPSANHTTCGVLCAPDAVDWLEKVMNGRNPSRGCHTRKVYTTTVQQRFLSIYTPEIAYAIQNAV